MQTQEINKNLNELRKEIMRLRAQASRGTAPENPGRIKTIKRTVARMLTKLNSKSNEVVKETVTNKTEKGGAK